MIVLDEVGLQHPIMSHTHDIFDLVNTQKISSLSMKLLKDVCHDLDVDCSNIRGERRKGEYEKKLTETVKNCSCQGNI